MESTLITQVNQLKFCWFAWFLPIVVTNFYPFILYVGKSLYKCCLKGDGIFGLPRMDLSTISYYY